MASFRRTKDAAMFYVRLFAARCVTRECSMRPVPFLSLMSSAVREEMKDAYPELDDMRLGLLAFRTEEESQFARTVEIGLKKLEEDLRDDRFRQPRARALDGIRRRCRQRRRPEASQEHERVHGDDGDPYRGKPVVSRTRSISALRHVWLAARFYRRCPAATRASLSIRSVSIQAMAGAAHARKRFLERRAQGSCKSCVYETRADTSRPSQIFTSARTTRDARIEAIITKEGAVNEIKKRRGSRNRARPHLDLLRIRRPGRRYRRPLR